jgi:hypothetical protein
MRRTRSFWRHARDSSAGSASGIGDAGTGAGCYEAGMQSPRRRNDLRSTSWIDRSIATGDGLPVHAISAAARTTIETSDTQIINVATTLSLRSSSCWIVRRAQILSTQLTQSGLARSAAAEAGANHVFDPSIALTDSCTLGQ